MFERVQTRVVHVQHLIIGICGIDFPFTTVNSVLSAVILWHKNDTALASLGYLPKWVQSTFHYIITKYMHMLVACGVKKKKFQRLNKMFYSYYVFSF